MFDLFFIIFPAFCITADQNRGKICTNKPFRRDCGSGSDWNLGSDHNFIFLGSDKIFIYGRIRFFLGWSDPVSVHHFGLHSGRNPDGNYYLNPDVNHSNQDPIRPGTFKNPHPDKNPDLFPLFDQ